MYAWGLDWCGRSSLPGAADSERLASTLHSSLTTVPKLIFLELALLLCCAPHGLEAQEPQPFFYKLSGGYSLLSNSPNGVQGARQLLNGFVAGLDMLPWRGLDLKAEAADYRGTNLNAQEHLLFLTGGGEYEAQLRREGVFTDAMLGAVNANRNWMQNGEAGQSTSLLCILGGGLDTPIRPRVAIRVQGDFVYMNLHAALASIPSPAPVYPNVVHGLPNFFGRVSVGLVWRVHGRDSR